MCVEDIPITISIAGGGYKEYLRGSYPYVALARMAPASAIRLLIIDYVANYSNVRSADISPLSVHG